MQGVRKSAVRHVQNMRLLCGNERRDEGAPLPGSASKVVKNLPKTAENMLKREDKGG